MAMFHISVDRILKGSHKGGSAGFAHYIARQQIDRASQQALYLDRTTRPDKHDLDIASHANLPAFAEKSPARFFALADQYERKGGIVARTYEIALPRELTRDQRRELVDDIRATLFDRHPYAFAIHNPKARDGQEQPHVHFMVHERIIDGIERSPEQFFRRAAPAGQDPATGGAKKEMYWTTRASLLERRATIALLTNAALERAGHTAVVDPRPIKDRGYRYEREPERDQGRKARYLYAHKKIVTKGWEQTLKDRERLHKEFYPYEHYKARQFWTAQKAREGLVSVDREAVVAHVRERFWGHEHAKESMQTRAMETWRAIEQEIQRRGPLPKLVPQIERSQQQGPTRRRRVVGLSRGRGVADEMREGAHVRLRDDYDQEMAR